MAQPCADAFDAIRYLARSDADLRVVVEITTLNVDDGEPAISHVRAAIDAGCHVVTANKGPVAFAYEDLRDAAAQAGVALPVRRGGDGRRADLQSGARDACRRVRIAGFEGVINTTTNHIITSMERGQAFDEALAQMQADGIAEADPSLDVDGWDAAAKTAALANVLMDARITPHDVDRTGSGRDHRRGGARRADGAAG